MEKEQYLCGHNALCKARKPFSHMHRFPEHFWKLQGRAVYVNTNITIFSTQALSCQYCVRDDMEEGGGLVAAWGIEDRLSYYLVQF